MLTNLSVNVDERIIEQMQASHPLKKLLTLAEVTDTVVYLINTSQQVNGMNVVINAAKNIF
jgi:enoyl-[acyl-carrier-protein] reductase (NADH)